MKILLLLPLLILTLNYSAQDPSFSLASENLTYVNPAFTGTGESFRVGGSYRNQWPSLSGSFVTTNLHVDQHFGKFGGVGLTYIHDDAANTLKTNMFYLDYAYQLDIGEEGVLSFGLEVGLLQRSLDWTKLTFGNMIDPRRGFVYAAGDEPRGGSSLSLDIGAGALYYNKTFFAGYAVHHLNEPNESLLENSTSRRPMLHNLFIGSKFTFGEISISPQLDIKKQAYFENYVAWLKGSRGDMTIGIGYRKGDAALFTLGFNFEKYRINYVHDFTVSKLSMATGGSHEIAFQMSINTFKKTNDRYFDIY